MTYTIELIELTEPADALDTAFEKCNENFETIADAFDNIEIETIPDQFEILYTPASYTPTITPECTAVTQLAAHLKGIDDALTALEGRIAALE